MRALGVWKMGSGGRGLDPPPTLDFRDRTPDWSD